MEKNQFKRNTFHELNFLDTIKNGFMDYTPIGVVVRAIEGSSEKTKNPILKPLEWVTNELDPVTINSSGIHLKTPEVVKDTEAAVKLIEKDIKYLGDEIYAGGSWVVNEVETIGSDVYNAGRGLYKFGSKTVTFIEDYYPVILFAGASYLAARYVNEIKTAIS